MTQLLIERLRAKDVHLKNGFTKPQVASVITPRVQELIILPTEKCNLRCTYCYEDFSIGKMSEDTQVGIENLILKRLPNLRRLHLSWFGGEPLVAKDVVLRLANFAHRASTQAKVDFSGGFTTNGYLLEYDLFEQLLNYNQNFFQITLDGWERDHDSVRKFSNGKGSFDVIWGNLIRMQTSKRSFDVTLRIHVRRDNIEKLPYLIEKIADTFLGDFRFKLDFQHLRDLGGDGGATITNPVNRTELITIEEQLRQVYYNALTLNKTIKAPSSGTRPLHVDHNNTINPESEIAEPYICYAAKPNSLLIRANGRIGKCTVALADSRNDIGYIRRDGSLKIDNDRLQPWLRGLSDLDLDALSCPLHLMAKTTRPSGMPVITQPKE